MEAYNEDDLEFSDYGRSHGGGVILLWITLSIACFVVDGLLLWRLWLWL